MKIFKEYFKSTKKRWLMPTITIVFSVFLMNSSQAAGTLPELQNQLSVPETISLPASDSSTFSVTHNKTKTVCVGSAFNPYCYRVYVPHPPHNTNPPTPSNICHPRLGCT